MELTKHFHRLSSPPFSPTSQVASTQIYILTIYAWITEHNTELFQKRETEIINQQQFLSHLNPSLKCPHKKSHPLLIWVVMKSGETKYKLLQEEKGGEELKNVSNAHYPPHPNSSD